MWRLRGARILLSVALMWRFVGAYLATWLRACGAKLFAPVASCGDVVAFTWRLCGAYGAYVAPTGVVYATQFGSATWNGMRLFRGLL